MKFCDKREETLYSITLKVTTVLTRVRISSLVYCILPPKLFAAIVGAMCVSANKTNDFVMKFLFHFENAVILSMMCA